MKLAALMRGNERLSRSRILASAWGTGNAMCRINCAAGPPPEEPRGREPTPAVQARNECGGVNRKGERGGTTPRGGGANASLVEFLIHGWPFIFVLTTRPVLPGEEVTLCYGDEYWQMLRVHAHNIAALRAAPGAARPALAPPPAAPPPPPKPILRAPGAWAAPDALSRRRAAPPHPRKRQSFVTGAQLAVEGVPPRLAHAAAPCPFAEPSAAARAARLRAAEDERACAVGYGPSSLAATPVDKRPAAAARAAETAAASAPDGGRGGWDVCVFDDVEDVLGLTGGGGSDAAAAARDKCEKAREKCEKARTKMGLYKAVRVCTRSDLLPKNHRLSSKSGDGWGALLGPAIEERLQRIMLCSRVAATDSGATVTTVSIQKTTVSIQKPVQFRLIDTTSQELTK